MFAPPKLIIFRIFRKIFFCVASKYFLSFLKIIPIFAKKKNITIMLPINTPAPEFSLPDQDEKILNLSD